LYHFLRKDPGGIVEDWKQFYQFDPDAEISWTNDPVYNSIFNFGLLILMDIAAIASVSNLIVVPGDPPSITFLRAIPFVALILIDIGSETLILLYHDIPLCNHEDDKLLKHVRKFQVGRVLQIFVLVCWYGALAYMIITVQNLQCVNTCTCVYSNQAILCNSTQCPANGTCGADYCSWTKRAECNANNTLPFPTEYESEFTANCTIAASDTIEYCIHTHPSFISCVLLGLILFEGTYEAIGIFFKSYVLPITLPDEVMFQLYLMNDNIDGLINRLGKSEFGFHWNKSLLDTLIADPVL